MRIRRSLLIFVILIAAVSAVYAAATGSIVGFSGGNQPIYQVSGTGLVRDYEDECMATQTEGGTVAQPLCGCDLVTMMMTDANGLITDIDTFCIWDDTGTGEDYTDWCSYEGGCNPTVGPITYSLFDTAAGSVCDNNFIPGTENSVACANLLLSGAVTCLDEEYYQPPSLPVGTARPVCVPRAGACPVPLPAGSVVYSVPNGAPTYWAARLDAGTNFNLPAGSWYVSEFSGDFAKVWVACQANMVWIPVSAVAR